MDPERWEALVRRLEKVARRSPKSYRRRVALLAGLGFAYLGAVLALLVLATAFFVLNGLRGYPQGFLYVIPLNRKTRRLRKRLQRTVAPVYARATA